MTTDPADVDAVMTALGATHPVDRNAILNDLGDVLIKHYGSVPLDVRYGAAEAAVRIVEQDREEWRRSSGRTRNSTGGHSMPADHIPGCTGLGSAAADAGEAAAKVHAVDVEAFELAKHACQLLLQAHQRAHRHCPTADTHWPTGQPKPYKEH